MKTRPVLNLLCLALPVFLVSCSGRQETVVVYTAHDRVFSEPIFRRFEQATGIRVLPKYDAESTKTIGLVNTIIAEAAHPRCDVFWNNEIINTIRLKNKGLLDACAPSNAAFYPPAFRDPEGCWYGFAARARVIIVNTNLVAPGDIPRRVADLAAPAFRGRAGIAKPLFGTTASHAASLFAVLGPDAAKALLTSLKANGLSIESGNKSCAVKVARGQLAAALTDTDDAVIELRSGAPVTLVFPDGGDGEIGTLLIPNTVSLVKGCPRPDAGRALIDFLLSQEVEEELARGEAAQIPLNSRSADKIPFPVGEHRWMTVDFAAAADLFEPAAAWVNDTFLAP